MGGRGIDKTLELFIAKFADQDDRLDLKDRGERLAWWMLRKEKVSYVRSRRG
jgi:hypothetical protein